ncbi:group I intron-associated PD-(D/E)XK endonuclease [Tomitella gaofuii]|uniref:group I intron-associated PD-(D/E)XK endonuclease n=1 Tax=Tomitella gaofuii TaxID=2760083 RepID=UPI0015FB4EA1|nr:group I intron-associated PD-(D/E)XK endonuclease [Tomitella gaofuii]
MTRGRTYTDDELADAIDVSRSWRGVLRELGLLATSAGAMRSVRANADRLGLDYAHFCGQRRWADGRLQSAVAEAESWTDVVDILGLQSANAVPMVKAHAARIGIDVDHLAAQADDCVMGHDRPRMNYLSRAGSLLAAAWFTLCGHRVSWPLEPARYDLIVDSAAGVRRVQVKTTTVRVAGTWKVYLSTTRRERKVYCPEEIDDFFIIDGDLGCFLIPVAVVGGLQAVHLSKYDSFRLEGFSALVEG